MSSTGSKRTFLKDLQELYRKIESSTDGQASVLGANGFVIVVKLRPNSGCNAHAAFDITITCSHQYPAKCPQLSFSSPIFHPNINFSSGNICLSLTSDWNSCYGLLDIVKSMLFLISNPNFDSPNNEFGVLQEGEVLEVMTKRVLAGLSVRRAHMKIPPNRAWCEWAAERGFRPEDEELVNDDASINDKLIALSSLPSKSSLQNFESETIAEGSSFSSWSSCSSLTTIPSVARIRYSAPNESPSSYATGHYECSSDFLNFLQLQRIIIEHPDTLSPPVYYYCEVLGIRSHRRMLGIRYTSLFTGNVNEFPTQDGQWSSSIPWFSHYLNKHYSRCHYSSRTTTPCFDLLFGQERNRARHTPLEITLTDDFCVWAQTDNLGARNILVSLFKKPPSSPESLDGELGDLFAAIALEVQDAAGESEEQEEMDSDDDDDVITFDAEEKDEDIDQVTENEEDHGKTATQTAFSSRHSTKSESDRSDISVQSYDYVYDFEYVRGQFPSIEPQWKWFFRQTRWPLSFAPCQGVNVTMDELCVPSWRASAGRLMLDVCNFCARRPDMVNLVLLDPMALSPLSPLLNMLRFSTECRPHLNGVLWLTPLDALSPFYRVPLPRCSDGETQTHPSAIQLRLLTLAAFLSNWLNWLSRIEAYSSLDKSRISSELICDSVAAHLLQPLSLGCGQTPIFDLWPLWLARSVVSSLLPLAISLPLPGAKTCVFVPFSDVDEI